MIHRSIAGRLAVQSISMQVCMVNRTPSLVALSDLVISAGGTMNREAVALGTPVFTTFEGKLGAVDEQLLDEGRLLRLSDPSQVELVKREGPAGERVRRDPRELVRLLLTALD